MDIAALDGNILLKFLLETRLKSESFDTLDDLLWFGFKSYDLKTVAHLVWKKTDLSRKGSF